MRLSLFTAPRLADAGPLYGAVVAEARQPSWYLDAGIPDSLDGRFAVLTSLLALADLRLERAGEEARSLAPRLAEKFIADMDAQMREAGFGDPGLGRQVRTMVGSLAAKVDRWRAAIEGASPWEEAARLSLYAESPNDSEHQGIALTKDWWRRLQAAADSELVEGLIG